MGLARLAAASDPASEGKPDAAGAFNAARRAFAMRPLTVYSPGAGAAANHVFALKIDRAGRMWIGTAAGQFLREHPLGEPRSRRVDPDSPDAPIGQVEGLAEGPDGTL